VEIFIDSFAFFKAQKRAVLPKDGGRVGHGAGKSFMARLQRSVAELHTVIEYLPEFIYVALCGKTYIHQIHGDNALIEAAVILRLAVFIHIWRQKAAAAHAGVAVTLAVFIDLVFKHNLFGNVIGHHSLCGALCRKLR